MEGKQAAPPRQQVPGDAPNVATVRGHGDLLTPQTFPSLVTAPWSRKRAGNCRANVCKRELGCGRSAELPPRGTRRQCQPLGGGKSCSGPQPARAVTLYMRAVLGAGSQDRPWGCSKLTRTRKETAKSSAQGERLERVLPPGVFALPEMSKPHGSPQKPLLGASSPPRSWVWTHRLPSPPSPPASLLQHCGRRLQRAS